jgi:hypothetical protein
LGVNRQDRNSHIAVYVDVRYIDAFISLEICWASEDNWNIDVLSYDRLGHGEHVIGNVSHVSTVCKHGCIIKSAQCFMNFYLRSLNFVIVRIFFGTNGFQLCLSCGNLVGYLGKGVSSCLGSVVHYLSNCFGLSVINFFYKFVTYFCSLFVHLSHHFVIYYIIVDRKRLNF